MFDEARAELLKRFDAWAKQQGPDDYDGVEDILVSFSETVIEEVTGDVGESEEG